MTLLSLNTKTFYTKNKELFKNDFIKGTPDIIHSGTVYDIKSSWDIFTFWKSKTSKIDNDYWWQLQGYMELTDCESAKLVYCLVDTPAHLIEDEKRKLFWKMGIIDDSKPEYIAASDELARLMTYEDIPMQERIHIFEIQRDREAIERLNERIVDCRAFMNGIVV